MGGESEVCVERNSKNFGCRHKGVWAPASLTFVYRKDWWVSEVNSVVCVTWGTGWTDPCLELNHRHSRHAWPDDSWRQPCWTTRQRPWNRPYRSRRDLQCRDGRLQKVEQAGGQDWALGHSSPHPTGGRPSRPWTGSLTGLSQVQGIYAQAYADNIVILAAGANSRNLSAKIQEGMDMVSNWCQTTGLTLGARKTTATMFTWKRIWRYNLARCLGEEINLVENISNWGVTLNAKLSWTLHIKSRAAKANNCLMIYKQT